MRAIDTNVLVRLITRDDARQTAAAEDFVRSGAWVPVLALAEAMWVLSSVYGIGPKAQGDAIEMLLNHRELVIEDQETVRAAVALYRAKPGLGFSDCLMLHCARRAGHLPLGTFDRHLAKLDGAKKV